MPKSRETSLLNYLKRLITKHELDSDVFINCLFDARKTGESECDGLTVTYRGDSDGDLIFLLTKNRKVAGQFQLPRRYLRTQSSFFSALKYPSID